MEKNRKLIFHLQISVENVTDLVQNRDQNQFRVLHAEDKEGLDLIKASLLYNKPVQNAVVLVNKFLVLAKNVEVLEKNKPKKK